MKFSIIVPAYNAEKEIEKTIESVLKQNYKDYELIIINDCSTDNTKQVIERFKNVKLINHTTNKKAGGARNTGINKAIGEYIFFLDSDDFLYDNNVLLRLNENINQNNKPDIVYLGFKAKGNSFNGEYIPNAKNSSKYNRIKEWKYANVWDVCWKRDFLKSNNIKFVEDKYFEDFVFYYTGVLKSSTCSYTDFPAIIYNSGREESMTTFINYKKIKDFYYNLELLLELYNEVDQEYKELFKEILTKQNEYINRLIKRLK